MNLMKPILESGIRIGMWIVRPFAARRSKNYVVC